MRFCLIGGFPRSGTRQFLDILNRHPEFRMRGEIHRELIVALDQLVQKAESCHAGKWTEGNFRESRRRLVLENIRLLGKGGSSRQWPNQLERYRIGFKMPYVEMVKPSLDHLLKPEFGGVDFFYCVRNLEQNFLSQKSKLGIRRQRFMSNTIASIDALAEMKQDDFYRIQVLHLDDYLASDDRADWLKTKLFDFLNVEGVTDQDLKSFASNTPNRNKTPNKDRLTALKPVEKRVIFGNDTLLDRIAWLESTYSMNITMKGPEACVRS